MPFCIAFAASKQAWSSTAELGRSLDAAEAAGQGAAPSVADRAVHRLDEFIPWDWAAERRRRKLAP
jgi:hypothetical protein